MAPRSKGSSAPVLRKCVFLIKWDVFFWWKRFLYVLRYIFKESMQVFFPKLGKDLFIKFMKNYLCMFLEFYLEEYPRIRKCLGLHAFLCILSKISYHLTPLMDFSAHPLFKNLPVSRFYAMGEQHKP